MANKHEQDYRYVRVPDDHPDRCQATGKTAQCPFKAVPGTNYCPRHLGGTAYNNKKREGLRMYNWGKWQQKIQKHAKNPEAKNILEELGLIRVMLETIVNQIRDDDDLLLQESRIVTLVREVNALVASQDKMDSRRDRYLDEKQAGLFVQQLIAILEDEVNDPEALERIANRLDSNMEDFYGNVQSKNR